MDGSIVKGACTKTRFFVKGEEYSIESLTEKVVIFSLHCRNIRKLLFNFIDGPKDTPENANHTSKYPFCRSGDEFAVALIK